MSDALEEVLRAFEGLVREHEVKTADVPAEDTNFRCVDCNECSSCRFCTACERCIDCTYCDACSDCEGCTQCRECLACAACSHTTHTAYCEKSSYLTLCLDCEGCVQCFACVGLTNEEFCILNQKYTRRAYFNKVNELRAALDARTLEGWFPPWMRETEAQPRPEGGDAPTVHPEPLTDIAAAERTGSWPPIDHASARALDRAGRSPWDALEEDARVVEAIEPDTVRRRAPEQQPVEARPTREPDPHRRIEPTREPEPPPAEAWMDAQRRAARERIERFEAEQQAKAPTVEKRTVAPPRIEDRPAKPAQGEEKPRVGSRFAEGEPASAPGRWEEPKRDRFEAAPVSLLDEADSGIVFDKEFPRALIDELPRAARRRAPEPEGPRTVDVEPPIDARREPEGDGRLTRGQRPTRPTDPAPNSLRSARRPRRPDP